MILLRATLFNILFYAYNIIASIIFVPVLFMNRDAAFWLIGSYVGSIAWLERHVLGLHLEVRGRENLPEGGAYIVAAKHQSAFETFKLHVLWRDPAVILKKELIKVPLWGRYLARSEPIAIDRSSGRDAIRQIVEGAAEVKKAGRVLVIFPQGTRVWAWQTTQDKPYRVGVAQVASATGMPLIPMAHNAGMFWPRSGWIKYPGKVVFEFLPPVATDIEPAEILRALELRIETATERLEEEAARTYPRTAHLRQRPAA